MHLYSQPPLIDYVTVFGSTTSISQGICLQEPRCPYTTTTVNNQKGEIPVGR